MADDVVDIRKRIEEIRNEVSTAMASNRATAIDAKPAGEIAEFSVPGVHRATRQPDGRQRPATTGGNG